MRIAMSSVPAAHIAVAMATVQRQGLEVANKKFRLTHCDGEELVHQETRLLKGIDEAQYHVGTGSTIC